MATPHPQLHLVTHPLIDHLLTEARDTQTPPARFTQLVSQISIILATDATRDLKLKPHRVTTPLEDFDGHRLASPPTIVPILRAGLGMAQDIFQLMPGARIGHIGVYRDEANLKPVHYYESLPTDAHVSPVIIVDPMLATGGSAIAAVDLLKKRNCTDIRLICLVAAPQGVDALHAKHPAVPVYAAALDSHLDERGFIVPGLGDAGDRQFGTGA